MSLADEFRERAIEARRGWLDKGSYDYDSTNDVIREQSLQIQSVLYEIGAAIVELLNRPDSTASRTPGSDSEPQ